MTVNDSGGAPLLSARVAEEIRALLARQRRSGRWLASALGVSQTWMSSRLTGSTPIDLNDLQRIATVLEVDWSDLIPARATQAVGSGPARSGQTTVPTVEQPKRPMPTSGPKRAVPPASSRRPARLVPHIPELMTDDVMAELLDRTGR